MATAKTRVRKRGVMFAVACIVMSLVALSIAMAIATVDACGDESAPKHWEFFPPHWECDPVVRSAP